MTVHRWSQRVAASVTLVGAVVALLVGIAAPALAHAVLVDSDPGDGEVVEGAPEAIVLVFSEPMQAPATIAVTDPDGEPVGDDEAEVDGAHVRRSFEGLAAADGTYSVSWRAVSADDHPISGELTFEVVDAEPAPPTGAATTTPAPPETPAATSSPEPLIAEEPAAAGEDAGGIGTLGWLLGGAVVVAAVATGAALRFGRTQPGD